jgi:hypothetical protein
MIDRYKDFNIGDVQALITAAEKMDVPTAIRYSSPLFINALLKAVDGKIGRITETTSSKASVVELYGLKLVEDVSIPLDRIRLEYLRSGEKQFIDFSLK